jgi:CrcB protein
MSPAQWFAFLVAAAIGAVTRTVLDQTVRHRVRTTFPLGILTVNITGCFGLGILTGLGLYHGLSASARTVLGTGAMGAYTTFSTFTADTVRLAEAGDAGGALKNVAANALLGFAAAALGFALAGL